MKNYVRAMCVTYNNIGNVRWRESANDGSKTSCALPHTTPVARPGACWFPRFHGIKSKKKSERGVS